MIFPSILHIMQVSSIGRYEVVRYRSLPDLLYELL